MEAPELILALPDDEPDIITASPSQIGVWNRCTMKWHIGYQLNWTQKEAPHYFDRGHLIHEGLEGYYQRIKDGKIEYGDADFLKTDGIIQSWLDRHFDISMISEVGKLLTRYIQEFSVDADKGMKVLDVERHIIVELVTPKGRKYRLQGIMDLLVEVNGYTWVIDHKSAGSAKFKSQAQVDMDVQLPMYGIMLNHLGTTVDGMMFNFLNTYAYKGVADTDKLFGRIVTGRTETEQQNLLREIGMAVDDMYDRRDNPRRALGSDCDRCAFQEPCLLTMRGMAFEDVMPAKFRQKDPKPEVDRQDNEVELA